MNITRFQAELGRYTLTDYRDSTFEVLRQKFYGQAGIRTAKLLNLASLCLEGFEIYLEIGTFMGYTLASAGYENRRTVVGIDKDLHEAKGSTKGFLQHTKTMLNCQQGLNWTLLEDDFRNIRLDDHLGNSKVGVFFVDGDHTYQDVKDSLGWVKPHLAENSVIIFDDLGTDEVRRAIDELKGKCLFRIEVEPSERFGCVTNPYFANGIAIYVPTL